MEIRSITVGPAAPNMDMTVHPPVGALICWYTSLTLKECHSHAMYHIRKKRNLSRRGLKFRLLRNTFPNRIKHKSKATSCNVIVIYDFDARALFLSHS